MTPLQQARDAHLTYRARTCDSADYLGAIRKHVDDFIAESGVEYVDQITPYIVNRFAESHAADAHARSHVRQFLRFCRERFNEFTPQLAQNPNTTRRHPQILRGIAERRIARWQEAAARAAAAMRLPHQRAIFLLGYLYGFPLKRVMEFSRQDLFDLGETVREDLYDALSAVPPGAWGPDIAIFSPWLGTNIATARKHWREWVGEGAKFDDVVRAGQVDRVAAGMAPRCEQAVAQAIVNALPGVSKTGLERMRKWWD